MSTVMWIVGIIAVVICGLILWRFVHLRTLGTSVVLRCLPASGVHGWRHGLMRYSGDTVSYYKLRSLWPAADVRFSRRDMSLGGRRDMTPGEASFMPEGQCVVDFSSGEQQWEAVMDARGVLAFTSWVESAPNRRSERTDAAMLKHRNLRR